MGRPCKELNLAGSSKSTPNLSVRDFSPGIPGVYKKKIISIIKSRKRG
jgi:hypothetical protein